MLAYALRRLLMIVPVLIGISVIVFLVIWLIPGDTAHAILGTFATPENIKTLNAELGLDRSLPEQYLIWIGNVLSGDFGRSYVLHKPVITELGERLTPTLLLAGAALVLSCVFGILFGIIAAIRQNAWQDRLITVTVLIGISTPSFWLGILLIFWFGVRLAWFASPGLHPDRARQGAERTRRHLQARFP
jgi:peptide/nickel transport system permease protein